MGVVCLGKGIVMFFVGLLVLRFFVGVKWVMDICGLNVESFSRCQVSHGYLRVLRSALPFRFNENDRVMDICGF